MYVRCGPALLRRDVDDAAKHGELAPDAAREQRDRLRARAFLGIERELRIDERQRALAEEVAVDAGEAGRLRERARHQRRQHLARDLAFDLETPVVGLKSASAIEPETFSSPCSSLRSSLDVDRERAKTDVAVRDLDLRARQLLAVDDARTEHLQDRVAAGQAQADDLLDDRARPRSSACRTCP